MVLILYAIYLYYRSLSLRKASSLLSQVIKRSHVSIWKWIQRYRQLLGMASRPARKDVKTFFVDETFVQLGSAKVAVWIAYDPSIKAVLGFHVSREPNSVDAYLFLLRLVITYGKRPVYTDGAMWYNDACRWLGLYHVVYGFDSDKAIIERIMEHIKDRTEVFDGLFPLRSEFRNGLEHIKSWLGAFVFMLNAFDLGGVYVEPTLAAYVMEDALMEVSLS
ncbi:MAG: IS6 family transposase [Nitrososphaerota archaeon]|nr:IS6 family transposase [Nitrososphaerota archaeon]